MPNGLPLTNQVNPYSAVTSDPWQAAESNTSPSDAGRPGSACRKSGGVGAVEAVNPEVPLSQIQFQNVFVPES